MYEDDDDSSFEVHNKPRPQRGDDSTRESCVYSVQFEVLSSEPDSTKRELVWVPDELMVLATRDAQTAIDKLRAWVMTEATYGIEVKQCRIQNVILIGDAEVC